MKKYALGYFGKLLAPVDPDVLDRIVENGSPKIALKPQPLPPAVDKLRKQYPNASDDERMLRFMFAGSQVDEMLAAGPMATEYVFEKPLVELVRELAAAPHHARSLLHRNSRAHSGQSACTGTGTTSSSGAGSAGCVLANRLSADGRKRVLLLEAGGNDRYIWIHVPVGYFKTMHNPRTDWMFKTEPCAGARRPQARLAPRQGARRIELDQRPALHPRARLRFQPLAATGLRRLELRRRPALFQARGGPGAWRRRWYRAGSRALASRTAHLCKVKDAESGLALISARK